jgi:hypothetical protein
VLPGERWFVGVNFTMLDVSCSSGDRIKIYFGVDATGLLLWSSCSSTEDTPVVWTRMATSSTMANLYITFESGSSSASGVGAGWRAVAIASAHPVLPGSGGSAEVSAALAAALSPTSPSFCPGPGVVTVPGSGAAVLLSSFGPPVVSTLAAVALSTAPGAGAFPYPYTATPPRNYSRNVDCVWRLTAASASAQVLLTFFTLDVHTQRPTVCAFDFVEVNGVRLCGAVPRASIPRMLSLNRTLGACVSLA